MTQQTQKFNIEGMTCGNCVKSVEKVVSELKGVTSIEVSLEDHQATVTFDDTQVIPAQIVETIEDAGFDAKEQHD